MNILMQDTRTSMQITMEHTSLGGKWYVFNQRVVFGPRSDMYLLSFDNQDSDDKGHHIRFGITHEDVYWHCGRYPDG